MSVEKATVHRGREIVIEKLKKYFAENEQSFEYLGLDDLKGELVWNGRSYKIKSCDTRRNTRIVIEYSTDTYSDKTLDFDGYIFVDRDINFQDVFFIVKRKEVFEAIDKYLGRSKDFVMTDMSQDILENNGLCVSCNIRALQKLGILDVVVF